MNDDARDALRQSAGDLRARAATGVLAVMAARDLQAVVPATLTRLVSQEIESGAFEQRWVDALQEAEARLPNATGRELALAAIAGVLAWHQNLAREVIKKYADKIESERRGLEGRVAGIEEALAVLEEPPA